MHLSYVQPLAHVEGMPMAWLPKERIVIEADLLAFLKHVQTLGLDVATIAPIHGRAVGWSDFMRAMNAR